MRSASSLPPELPVSCALPREASHLKVDKSGTLIHTQGPCQCEVPKAGGGGGEDLIRVNGTIARCRVVHSILVVNKNGRPCFMFLGDLYDFFALGILF